MRIESSQYKRFLRHECRDSEYRNKIFSSLSESDMVFTQKQILKNIPNASNRFEDYLIAFSNDDLEMLFECLIVGLGGFVGSVLRYLMGFIKVHESTTFPVNTFFINMLGVLLISETVVTMSQVSIAPFMTLTAPFISRVPRYSQGSASTSSKKLLCAQP